MEIDEEIEIEHLASSCSPFEDDFEQTIALLEMDVDEVQIEVQQALEEVEGKKQFPCRVSVSVRKFAQQIQRKNCFVTSGAPTIIIFDWLCDKIFIRKTRTVLEAILPGTKKSKP
ncbi:Hypothetical predicted protein [Paramuricea clavata]|uniref:Uncharacterized protein n=1 Tax=Paramuricea clavata TaxID=317549 RepID=A0A6S7ISZ3_PARCT|nr:Hypothetical predicted protein [Paramuricea clavata]